MPIIKIIDKDNRFLVYYFFLVIYNLLYAKIIDFLQRGSHKEVSFKMTKSHKFAIIGIFC